MPRPALFVAAARVVLTTIPTAALEARLASRGDFSAATALDSEGTLHDVCYPATWPGNLSALLPAMLKRRREPNSAVPEMIGAIVEPESHVAVGDMGTHGPPSAAGVVEIGYDVGEPFRNRGYASEMLAAFAAWLLARDEISLILAETLADNAASMRVLEKNGFKRTGTRVDAEGAMILWQRRA